MPKKKKEKKIDFGQIYPTAIISGITKSYMNLTSEPLRKPLSALEEARQM